jgi:hypothetical protein
MAIIASSASMRCLPLLFIEVRASLHLSGVLGGLAVPSPYAHMTGHGCIPAPVRLVYFQPDVDGPTKLQAANSTVPLPQDIALCCGHAHARLLKLAAGVHSPAACVLIEPVDRPGLLPASQP